MKNRFTALVILFFVLQLTTTIAQNKPDIIFQTSTIDALMNGIYDGPISLKDLKEKGNFGVGTYNGLDGEMILLDGIFYKVDFSGKVIKMNLTTQSPFAAVTKFKADKKISASRLSFKELQELIDKNIPSNNLFYAIKVEGKFSYVKTRSVPKQQKPYPKLVEVTKNQAVFEFKDIKGTLVGIRTPELAKGINVPGYHLHFISKDKTGGGHLLACDIENAEILIDQKQDILLSLPETKEFLDANFSKDTSEDIKKAEK
ncbi:MAG: acetolactate decarboxylase [Ignavibacteriales bacterium]|nr:MAG: acetolactate decarboxylase [Ignavibacteriales bacterium]